jgi:hypothetical protein
MPSRRYNGRKREVKNRFFREMLTLGIFITKLMEGRRSALFFL